MFWYIFLTVYYVDIKIQHNFPVYLYYAFKCKKPVLKSIFE